jgi:hypothetical protein
MCVVVTIDIIAAQIKSMGILTHCTCARARNLKVPNIAPMDATLLRVDMMIIASKILDINKFIVQIYYAFSKYNNFMVYSFFFLHIAIQAKGG